MPGPNFAERPLTSADMAVSAGGHLHRSYALSDDIYAGGAGADAVAFEFHTQVAKAVGLVVECNRQPATVPQERVVTEGREIDEDGQSKAKDCAAVTRLPQPAVVGFAGVMASRLRCRG